MSNGRIIKYDRMEMERSGHRLFQGSVPELARYNWSLNLDFKVTHPE
jgi:hypothetical protein